MQGDEAFEIVREIAPFRLAAAECVAVEVLRVAQVVDAGKQRAEPCGWAMPPTDMPPKLTPW